MENDNELSRIHHIAVPVSDLKKAVKWYMTSFSCRPLYESPREVILEFENIRLALVLPSEDQPHFAVLKSDAAAFGELRDRSGGVRSTFVADPAGNMVELVGETGVGGP